MAAIKVKELNKYIKKYIAMDYILSDVEVEGEISNFKIHTNGNIYFSLKDDVAKINVVMYSSDARNLEETFKDGDNVEVRGSVSLYEREGSISLYIKSMKLIGMGDLFSDYLKLKEKLYKEGLFDEAAKKTIPYFPKKVGIITSSTGAAIRDIINVLHRRNPAVDIILYPANVQGEYAVEHLLEGLKYFESEAAHKVDTIIIGRGGGSIEELFSFNDEELAREIFKSKTPIISAVGHEIDYVISDFVSDLRAPTPSAAAEIVSMSREDLNKSLELSLNRLNLTLSKKIDIEREKLKNSLIDINLIGNSVIKDSYNNLKFLKKLFDYNIPNVVEKRELLNREYNILNMNIKNILKYREIKLCSSYSRIRFKNKVVDYKKELCIKKDKLDNSIKDKIRNELLKISKLNDRLQYLGNIDKIYVRDINGNIIKSSKELSVDNLININFIDGSVKAKVLDIESRGDKNE